MKKITFKEFLIEAPIGDYKTIGNFDKASSYRHLRDRKIITSPRAIEIAKKKFSNNENTFNLFFVNTAAANRWTEVGVVNLEWVRKNLGDEVANQVAPYYGGDDINVIFTNNKGAQNMPMTPWIMAHRIAHALGRYEGYPLRRRVYAYEEANDVIINAMRRIFELYKIKNNNRPDSFSRTEYSQVRKSQLLMKHFFTSVCTFRSARTDKIRDWFEVLHELFAQYITTGNIKFKEVPDTFGSNVAFGKGTGKFSISPDDKQLANRYLSTLSHDLKYIFEAMLSEVCGKILVM